MAAFIVAQPRSPQVPMPLLALNGENDEGDAGDAGGCVAALGKVSGVLSPALPTTTYQGTKGDVMPANTLAHPPDMSPVLSVGPPVCHDASPPPPTVHRPPTPTTP
ncbi:hypothetical protein G7Z17_g11623 [Cylindrodendrum hubeiense]|uniref:Uncharacterized protein n=1 Tax=Cylindrodendrum hubeiense TaxID=595255 RepID=A0A9P5GVJ8_9HYPO|nr:hypothetical protein G7Z17_g11623 [Cylindrodendrum hubeiense]